MTLTYSSLVSLYEIKHVKPRLLTNDKTLKKGSEHSTKPYNDSIIPSTGNCPFPSYDTRGTTIPKSVGNFSMVNGSGWNSMEVFNVNSQQTLEFTTYN